MRKLLLGTVGLGALGMATPALAADLAAKPYTKAPPYVAATVYDWSGLYFGGNAGYGSSRESWSMVTPGTGLLRPEGNHNANGGLVGGQIGYRWQVGTWVFGVEGQGDWAGLKGSNLNLLNPAIRDQTKVNALGLMTGQVGYAFNNALFYVKGGAAVTGNKYNELMNANGAAITNGKDTRWGGVIGVGAEYGFAPNWSAGINYDHLFMGTKNDGFTNAAGALVNTQRISQDVDLVTLRINYKFGAVPMMGMGMGMMGMGK
jgi:outer membrane immunogenic protein